MQEYNLLRKGFDDAKSFSTKVLSTAQAWMKKNGPTILKEGAITALAAVDLAAQGTGAISGIEEMYKDQNVLTAA